MITKDSQEQKTQAQAQKHRSTEAQKRRSTGKHRQAAQAKLTQAQAQAPSHKHAPSPGTDISARSVPPGLSPEGYSRRQEKKFRQAVKLGEPWSAEKNESCFDELSLREGHYSSQTITQHVQLIHDKLAGN
jgi:hypothetical protein